MRGLTDFVAFYGDAWTRIGYVQPAEMRNTFTDPPETPFHVLQDREDLLEELCTICERIFNTRLTLDRLSRAINLRVGETGIPAPSIDHISSEYRERLAKLPPLMEQGDGMKSLIGLLVPIVTSSHQLVILDEPEAFLHPPQAGALGRILGEQARSKNLQVIIATHDKNLLAGVLESSADINIVRLTRPNMGPTRAHQLPTQALRDIWQDPVLKYTNILDGLFHRLVVLAEGEADCRFYAAALSEREEAGTTESFPASEVLFVPSGGKANLKKLTSVLKAVQVPVVASPDLDVLNNRETLKSLVKAFGGDWHRLEILYNTAVSRFRQPPDRVNIGTVLAALKGSAEGREGEQFTAAVRREFTEQMRLKGNPWEDLKNYGTRAFRGQSAKAAEELLAALDEIGIVTVRVGELEHFAPTLDVSKGPEWLPAALSSGAHRGRDVQDHISRLTLRSFPE
ncbi:AAA family ATPase [Streptomyces sp. Qhu-G9]|uniref:ATP-dependent nuclease n=1 Tax=Streptomyces sp. Qhu-G9 TaxID=3452799 RepID=UPI0022AC8F75|nr:AAA family ATPase [Streptomyces aurantiacus]WAU82563.1 AAA family ATPase [Streptomyces aurantiacus]